MGQEGQACRDLNADGHPAQTLVTSTVEPNPRAVRGFESQVPVMTDKEPLGSPLCSHELQPEPHTLPDAGRVLMW